MATYSFDLRGGRELRVSDDKNTIILQMRDDGIGLNVKDDETFHQYPADVRKALDQLGDTRGEGIYEGVRADFWTWAEECAQRHGFEEVYQDGRSGGWLVLAGTGHLGAAELAEPGEMARCDDCEHVHPVAELAEPKRLSERLDPGGTVPAGECPDCGALAYPLEAGEDEDRDLRDRALACFFEVERSIEEQWRPEFFERVKVEAAERPHPSQMENSTPYKETFTQAAELLNVMQAVGNYDAEILPTFGVETDPADKPEQAREEARESLEQMVTETRATATLELALDGPDERRLVFECEVGAAPRGLGPLAGRLTIKRVLYGFGEAENAELKGTDRNMACELAGVSVLSIFEAERGWDGGHDGE